MLAVGFWSKSYGIYGSISFHHYANFTNLLPNFSVRFSPIDTQLQESNWQENFSNFYILNWGHCIYIKMIFYIFQNKKIFYRLICINLSYCWQPEPSDLCLKFALFAPGYHSWQQDYFVQLFQNSYRVSQKKVPVFFNFFPKTLSHEMEK